jgi:branched-chain amino acid aminotransferase
METYYAGQSFVTGTFDGVRDVREIDGRIIGDGNLGPMTMKLQDNGHVLKALVSQIRKGKEK